MGEKLYVIFFTVIITAIFVGGAAALNSALAETTAQNKVLAKQRVVLNLFGMTKDDEVVDADTVNKLFEEKIKPIDIKIEGKDGKPATYTYYATTKAGDKTVVIPVSGMGFWDKIKGFLAVDMSDKTIKGIDFTDQAETPGLGGRIGEPEIRARFVGKTIGKLRDDGVRLRIRKNPVDEATDIEAITGATETSKALQKLLNDSIDEFLELIKTKEGVQ